MRRTTCWSWPGKKRRGSWPARPRSMATAEHHPQVESYWGHVNPNGPASVYDEAKRYAEAVTMAYYREYGVQTRIVRIFNTYGPRMRANDGRVVTNLDMPGVARRTAYPVRRRLANAQFRPRFGFDRRHFPPAHEQRDRPGQHRQPKRVHGAPICHVIETTGSSSEIIVPLPFEDDPSNGGPTSRSSTSVGNRASR